MKRFVLAFLFAFLAVSSVAQTRNPAQYTRYLLPVDGYTPAPPFAFWSAVWWYWNEADVADNKTQQVSLFDP